MMHFCMLPIQYNATHKIEIWKSTSLSSDLKATAHHKRHRLCHLRQVIQDTHTNEISYCPIGKVLMVINYETTNSNQKPTNIVLFALDVCTSNSEHVESAWEFLV